ncbi:Uma2 family endonuclease [Streptomyces sp. BH055]|uniref:Uma2 family endonuclease n=1 Tax=Streptomyces sp. BH055 TaxID=3401173 RepID=UPI003BB787CF
MRLVAEEWSAVVLSQEEFEELDRLAAKVSDALRLEFVGARIREKPLPDGDHSTMVGWAARAFASADPGWWLTQGRGLRVGVGSGSNVRPDGTLAPSEAFVGQGEWVPADEVLMVLDVTSRDPETSGRDRREKPRLYAESGIPVYVLVDRDSHEVKVHSQSDGVRYGQVVTVPFGKAVSLPEPVGIELDTEPLKEWAR